MPWIGCGRPLHRKKQINEGKEGTGTMKISTKGRYAVRVMIDLATYGNGKCVAVRQIAERQQISEKYLEQIIGVLNKAGYVKSIRGAQGGYKLTRDPVDYTVGDILRLTEGSLCPVSCLEGNGNECDRFDTCATIKVWKRLQDAINDVVDHVTIQDLLYEETGGMDYSI